MDRHDSHTDTDLTGAWLALRAASDLAAEKVWRDPTWDLIYICLGTAILAIQACADLDLAAERDPDEAPGTQQSCAVLTHQAAVLLTRVDLGVYPSIAVAINAVADARQALTQVPA